MKERPAECLKECGVSFCEKKITKRKEKKKRERERTTIDESNYLLRENSREKKMEKR